MLLQQDTAFAASGPIRDKALHRAGGGICNTATFAFFFNFCDPALLAFVLVV